MTVHPLAGKDSGVTTWSQQTNLRKSRSASSSSSASSSTKAAGVVVARTERSASCLESIFCSCSFNSIAWETSFSSLERLDTKTLKLGFATNSSLLDKNKHLNYIWSAMEWNKSDVEHQIVATAILISCTSTGAYITISQVLVLNYQYGNITELTLGMCFWFLTTVTVYIPNIQSRCWIISLILELMST